MKKQLDKVDVALGNELKAIRCDKGMTMEEVSYRLNCSKSLISMYESGKASISIPQLIRLCDVYGVQYGNVLDKVRKLVYAPNKKQENKEELNVRC